MFPFLSLVDCVFLFPYFDSALCDSAYNFFVSVLNAHLYFGVDSALGHSGEIFPGFTHKYHLPYLYLLFCKKHAWYSSTVAFYSFSKLLFFSWYFRVLMSCYLYFSFHNHRADDFSLCTLLILSPWDVDYFLFNIGFTVHLPNWHILIGPNWILISTPYIY